MPCLDIFFEYLLVWALDSRALRLPTTEEPPVARDGGADSTLHTTEESPATHVEGADITLPTMEEPPLINSVDAGVGVLLPRLGNLMMLCL